MGFLVGLVAPDQSKARGHDYSIMAVNPLGVVVSGAALSDELRSAAHNILYTVVNELDSEDLVEVVNHDHEAAPCIAAACLAAGASEDHGQLVIVDGKRGAWGVGAGPNIKVQRQAAKLALALAQFQGQPMPELRELCKHNKGLLDMMRTVDAEAVVELTDDDASSRGEGKSTPAPVLEAGEDAVTAALARAAIQAAARRQSKGAPKARPRPARSPGQERLAEEVRKRERRPAPLRSPSRARRRDRERDEPRDHGRRGRAVLKPKTGGAPPKADIVKREAVLKPKSGGAPPRSFEVKTEVEEAAAPGAGDGPPQRQPRSRSRRRRKEEQRQSAQQQPSDQHDEGESIIRIERVPHHVDAEVVRQVVVPFGVVKHIAFLYDHRHKREPCVLVEFQRRADAKRARECMRSNYRFYKTDPCTVVTEWASRPRGPDPGSDEEDGPTIQPPACPTCALKMRWSSFDPGDGWGCEMCPAGGANSGALRWHCKGCDVSYCEACRVAFGKPKTVVEKARRSGHTVREAPGPSAGHGERPSTGATGAGAEGDRPPGDLSWPKRERSPSRNRPKRERSPSRSLARDPAWARRGDTPPGRTRRKTGKHAGQLRAPRGGWYEQEKKRRRAAAAEAAAGGGGIPAWRGKGAGDKGGKGGKIKGKHSGKAAKGTKSGGKGDKSGKGGHSKGDQGSRGRSERDWPSADGRASRGGDGGSPRDPSERGGDRSGDESRDRQGNTPSI